MVHCSYIYLSSHKKQAHEPVFLYVVFSVLIDFRAKLKQWLVLKHVSDIAVSLILAYDMYTAHTQLHICNIDLSPQKFRLLVGSCKALGPYNFDPFTGEFCKL